MSNVVKISTLVSYLKNKVESDMHLKSIMVSGEISNFTHHRSGHLYFSLKDDTAKMNCVMFRTNASRVNIELKEGMKVIVTCNVSMYEPQGNLQLYVTKIQSDGIGDLYLAFEKLKKKLNEEGLFDESHKKSLPLYPMNIAVISAKTGAAIQDVLSIISRRWPIAKVHLYPSLVQGEGAANDVIKNLQLADQNHHEIILLVRGGGSIEDLWGFNNEKLAREIFKCNTCVVSGVGHETDTTLVDYVSDLRAPTPSAAAELITPYIKDVEQRLEEYRNRFIQKLNTSIINERMQLEYYSSKALFQSSDVLLKDSKMRLMMSVNQLQRGEVYFQSRQHHLDVISKQLINISLSYLESNKKQLQQHIVLLDAYNPLQILKRGYSIAADKNGNIIRSTNDVSIDDKISIRLQDGEVYAKIEEES